MVQNNKSAPNNRLSLLSAQTSDLASDVHDPTSFSLFSSASRCWVVLAALLLAEPRVVGEEFAVELAGFLPQISNHNSQPGRNDLLPRRSASGGLRVPAHNEYELLRVVLALLPSDGMPGEVSEELLALKSVRNLGVEPDSVQRER
jgi:hypothetical protein